MHSSSFQHVLLPSTRPLVNSRLQGTYVSRVSVRAARLASRKAAPEHIPGTSVLHSLSAVVTLQGSQVVVQVFPVSVVFCGELFPCF